MVQWTVVSKDYTDTCENFWQQDSIKLKDVNDSKLQCVYVDEQSTIVTCKDPVEERNMRESIFDLCNTLCGPCQTELLFAKCSSTDKIFVSYNLTNQNIQSQRGFAFLYHLLPRLTTITLPSTRISTSLEFGLSPVSTMISQTSICVQQSIPLRCNTDYSLVLHKIDLAVSKTGICNYSPYDCFEERTYLQGICGGKSSCYIFPPLVSLSKWNNSKSTYFYAEYQCIPNRPKLNISIYSLSNSFEKAEGDPIFSSFCYTSEYKEC
ncbi:unnamed protein product [Rotaria sordida]|uniref:SUEL-type lectin domain-containing protein n=1 Tax=Rotaria sordida TaxID=392033 RepID=A0A814CTM6_9BILA|nr:unnamed protein product [Rotaria sordida]